MVFGKIYIKIEKISYKILFAEIFLRQIAKTNGYLRSFSPSDPEMAEFSRRFSANFRSDSEALAGRFHDL